MRAIVIDAVNRKIWEENPEELSLKYLQSKVNGFIETATQLENGDTLFVDEEGLLKDPVHFFEIEGGHQPFVTGGVLVGDVDENGYSQEAKSPLSDIIEKVKWLTFEEIVFKYH